jgi:hypothetical protein
MSSELERRLEGLLSEAPDPDPGAGEEALHRALRALQPAPPARRGVRTAVLVFAAVAVLLGIAAGSLAAAGALHVSIGQKAKQRPATTQLALPKGANGIAVIVNGRLSVVIKGGFRLEGQAATAVALSPHALYIAAGIGSSLVAMAPSGRRAWSHPTGGRVVWIAWRPDGLEIAYIVRRGRHLSLHLIYGNGKKDETIDRSVRAVRPSWRPDSLAVAYVGAGGRAVVYDLSHESRRIVAGRAPVTHLSFGPSGALALTKGGAGIGWLDGARAIARGSEVRLDPTPHLVYLRPLRLGGRIRTFEANGTTFAAAVVSVGTRVVAGAPGHISTVLSLPPTARVDAVVVG